MRVLILGVGGPIGSAIAKNLITAGNRVLGVSRTPRSIEGGQHLSANRTDLTAISDIIVAQKIDTVIDVIAYTEADTLPLLHAIDGKIDHYILISSADVYRQYGLLIRKETGDPDTGRITETSPLRTSRYPYRETPRRNPEDPQAWMDDYDKIPIEQAVTQMQSDWSTLRLPMVFGAKGKLDRFGWIKSLIADSSPTPAAWLDWVTTYDHIDNVGAAIAHAAHHDEARRQVFNIASFEPVSHRVWLDRFAHAVGSYGTVSTDASSNHPLAIAAKRMNLNVPLAISGKQLVESLSFQAPVAILQAVKDVLSQHPQLRQS